jgi:putative transcriptional regulator
MPHAAACGASLVQMMAESLAGQLLLASPSLHDPNFSRTVVLIGVHNEDGAMGVVLNRPSQVTVGEAVPQLQEAIDELEPVYVGGPVQPISVVCLAEFLDPAMAELIVLGRIGFPNPSADMDELARATARRRIFAGYAGWGEGQLDEEIDRGDWISDPALPEDVFSEDPLALWGAVLKRKGGSYALLARMPLDPSTN